MKGGVDMTRYFDMNGTEIQEHDVLECVLTGYPSVVFRDDRDFYMINGNPMDSSKIYLGAWNLDRYRVIDHLNW